ncbi:MAG: glycosyltransferase family 4 protein [Elusimicrobiota bacterium]|jgi:sugar transferase (PEP-CTERM/EpsH1 system associated)
MKILFIAHSFPYPLHEGVRLHVYHLLKHLSAHHEIHFICFTESAQEKEYLPRITPFCRSVDVVEHKVPKQAWKRLFNMLFQPDPYAVYQFQSARMHQTIERAARQFQPDIVHIDFVSMAQYAPRLKEWPKIFFPHDAMSMLFERNISAERNGLFRMYMVSQTRKMKAYESKILPWFEKTVVVSPVDRDVLQGRSPGAAIEWNPNGVDTDYFQPQPVPVKSNVVLFRGIMSFLPNYDAAMFFAKEVLPLIWAQRPDTEFRIVGDAAPKELRALTGSEPRIRLTGFVPDLREPMAEAAVIVSSMRIGSGIKNKILESLAMEKAVVATPMSLAGIDSRDGEHLLTADTPEQFARQTLRLLKDPSLRETLGKKGREFVLQNHSWSAHTETFVRYYREAIEARKMIR